MFGMARKNPVSAVDVAIGRRLTRLRKEFRMSREDWAARSKVATGIITRVELGRTPLRYEHARLLLSSLKGEADFATGNPLWLYEGEGDAMVSWPLFLPETERIGLEHGVLFSEFVSEHYPVLSALVNAPEKALLAENWVRPYRHHWEIMRARMVAAIHGFLTCEAVFKRSAQHWKRNSKDDLAIYEGYQPIENIFKAVRRRKL